LEKPGCQREFQRIYDKLAGRMDLSSQEEWRRYLDYYIHCCQDVDANVGRVLDALARSGQRDNTIVVFTSDHGDMGGSHRLRAKGCFAYEEIMNVPLIISAGRRFGSGVETHALASNVDIFPTLASLAGIEHGRTHLPGRDLTAVLRDPDSAEVRDHVLFHSDSEIHTPSDLYKDSPDNFTHPARIRCIRDKDWKYAYYFDPGGDAVEEELYWLRDDPLEMKNLAQDPGYRQKKKVLHLRLMEEENLLSRNFIDGL